MNRPLRLALVVFGLALVVYGMATLTGGWLGTPPWWSRERTRAEIEADNRATIKNFEAAVEAGGLQSQGPGYNNKKMPEPPSSLEGAPHALWPSSPPRSGREWISGAVIAVGAALMACGSAGSWREGRVCV